MQVTAGLSRISGSTGRVQECLRAAAASVAPDHSRQALCPDPSQLLPDEMKTPLCSRHVFLSVAGR